MGECLTISRAEAAAALGVSIDTIRRMERDGTIHTVPNCRRVRIPKSELARLLTPRPSAIPVVDSVVGGPFAKVRKIKLRQRLTA